MTHKKRTLGALHLTDLARDDENELATMTEP